MITLRQRAFLDMIAFSEIGPGLLAISDRGYNVCVGSTVAAPILFHDYSTHPKIRCERLHSDAAGRYQIMGWIWNAYRDRLNLPDFGHESQDRIAIQLITECHARQYIEDGHIVSAITCCKSRWASLPGAGYGQHENEMASLIAAFNQSLKSPNGASGRQE